MVGVKVVVGIVVGVKVVVGIVVGAGVLVVAVEDSEINTWDILMSKTYCSSVSFDQIVETSLPKCFGQFCDRFPYINVIF